MLTRLLIKNVALIDHAEIEFSKGLNVLSGETGSGKSVVLECINFVLGAKADKSFIREGATDCFVQAEFDVSSNQMIKSIMLENDFDQEGVLIISRKISTEGKNSVKINGNTATVGMLKNFTVNLIDVHGQSEHFSLLKNSNQLNLLDDLSGEKIVLVKSNLKEKIVDYKSVISSLNELGGDDSARLLRLDILDYQIKEIKDANLVDGEEDELVDLKKKLSNQEKIKNALYSVKNISSGDLNFFSTLSDCKKQMSSISTYSEDYENLYKRIADLSVELSDLSDTASYLIDGLLESSVDLDYVENRLELIKNLKRKYGNGYLEIMQFLTSAEEEKFKLENYNQLAKDLLNKKDVLEKEIYSLYGDLRNIRQETAKKFSISVKDELLELGMKDADFTVGFGVVPSIENTRFTSVDGYDNVDFMFSANLGETVKPLSNVISGGEMSRFMLAIKTQSSKTNKIPTFLFDEIDSGISGMTAKTVSYKFAKISKNTQIIAITHLPQISAMADTNLRIFKETKDGRTFTVVNKLALEGKINEVARLVGGDENNQTSLKLAKELIEDADDYKSKI